MWTGNYQEIITPTTSAATSNTFSLPQDTTNLTIICNGLAGSETAKLQIFEPISETFMDYLPVGGIVQCTSSINTINLVNTHGIFQLVKSSTVASVGATVQQSKGQ